MPGHGDRESKIVSKLRMHSLQLNNVYSYYFDEDPIEALRQVEFNPLGTMVSDPKKTNEHAHTLQMELIDDQDETKMIPWLASFIKPEKIKLKAEFTDKENHLVFFSKKEIFYYELSDNPHDKYWKAVKKWMDDHAEFDKELKKKNAELCEGSEIRQYYQMLCAHLAQNNIRYGWADKATVKKLRVTSWQRKGMILIFAAPQAGFIHTLTALNVTLGVIASTFVTPYYMYKCHVALELAKYRKEQSGRRPSREKIREIERDAMVIGLQVLLLTAFSNILMQGHLLSSPYAYKPLEHMMRNWSRASVNHVPIEAHVMMMVFSSLIFGVLMGVTTAARHRNNEHFKAKHFFMSIMIGIMAGLLSYSSSMVSGFRNQLSQETVEGIFEGLTALLLGSALHKLVSSARTAPKENAHAGNGVYKLQRQIMPAPAAMPKFDSVHPAHDNDGTELQLRSNFLTQHFGSHPLATRTTRERRPAVVAAESEVEKFVVLGDDGSSIGDSSSQADEGEAEASYEAPAVPTPVSDTWDLVDRQGEGVTAQRDGVDTAVGAVPAADGIVSEQDITGDYGDHVESSAQAASTERATLNFVGKPLMDAQQEKERLEAEELLLQRKLDEVRGILKQYGRISSINSNL